MKCEVCLELLEEYLDGELAAPEKAQVNEHLIACVDCTTRFASLTVEQELFTRYDREIEVSPFLWTRVAAHTVSENTAPRGWRRRFAGFFAKPLASAIAGLLLALAVGLVYLIARPPRTNETVAGKDKQAPAQPKPEPKQTAPAPQPDPNPPVNPTVIAAHQKSKPRMRITNNRATVPDQSDVLSSDLAYFDLDERDTARHIEQTQNLLRSIKNVAIAEGDEEIDVTYDKALSRRLLNENVVLRRDAEMKAKFPTKTLLADLEPFLIDIANLPDRARAEDVRVIKERVQKTEIVAALVDYQDRGTNNR